MFITAVSGECFIGFLNHNNIKAELVDVPETLWCGAAAYADDNESEPDIPALLEKYQQNCRYPKHKLANPNWSCCISIDYIKEGKAPRGIMFAQQVMSEMQNAAHDVFRMPQSRYIRLVCTNETARAAFGRDGCEVYELFGVIKDALPDLGYRVGTNGAQEIEMYDFGAGLSYAYVPVEAIPKNGRI